MWKLLAMPISLLKGTYDLIVTEMGCIFCPSPNNLILLNYSTLSQILLRFFFFWFIHKVIPFKKLNNKKINQNKAERDNSAQFTSVTQWCPTLCDPMDCSMPGFPVHHQLPELAQAHVH